MLSRSEKEEVKKIINDCIAGAREKEAAEITRGVVLEDNPVSRLLMPPRGISFFSQAMLEELPFFIVEKIKVWVFGAKIWEEEVLIVTGKTTYLTSRRMWGSYVPVQELLKQPGYGIPAVDYFYSLFHYVPGVAAVIERRTELETFFLMGVRSEKLGGTHTGMISIPAGLMKPGETVGLGNAREVLEETGLEIEPATAIVATDNPGAPNTTFVCRVTTTQAEVAKTFEAKGKTFIWVSKSALMSAINGDTTSLVKEFCDQRIKIPNDTKIAPDILEGLIALREIGQF